MDTRLYCNFFSERVDEFAKNAISQGTSIKKCKLPLDDYRLI